MLDSIRRHQKWLWMVIVVGVIVSFVVYFNPNQSFRGGGGFHVGGQVVGSVFGEPITRDQLLNALQETRLRFRLFRGSWPEEDEFGRQNFNQQQELRTRLLLIHELNELEVKVGDQAVADWIATVFRDPKEQVFRYPIYTNFIRQKLLPRGITEADFKKYAQHEIGIQHLVTLYGLAGKLVTPQEAESTFRLENERADTQIVLFPATNFLAHVTLDPTAIAQFYTNNAANYRVLERIQVAYVKFENTNFYPQADQKLTQITNLNARLEDEYHRRGTNVFPGLTPDQAKEKIRTELRDELALREARHNANLFLEKLIDTKPETPQGQPNPTPDSQLRKIAAAEKMEVKVTSPFDRFSQPSELNVPEQFAQNAFTLSESEPFSEQPVVAEDGVYAIAFHQRHPSHLPPLDAIRAKVTEDYRRDRAKALAAEAGALFHATATNAVAQGKSFQAAAADAKLTVIDLPPFSKQTPFLTELPNRLELNALKELAFSHTDPFPPFKTTENGGFVVHVQARLPVEEEKVKTDLPLFLNRLRQERQVEAFQEWLEHRAELAQIQLPELR